MAASGNYKNVPDEDAFVPSSIKPEQTRDQIISELMKLQKPQG